MCGMCEKRYGQNAKAIDDSAAPSQPAPSRRTSKYIKSADSVKAIRTTELVAATALCVLSQTGIAITPATRLASENASVFSAGKNMLASNSCRGCVVSACATQPTFQTL